MGIERVKFSARMTEANAEFVAQLCERWSPVVEGVSATLNLIVAVVRRMERAGTIDLSLAGMQRLLRGHGGQIRQNEYPNQHKMATEGHPPTGHWQVMAPVAPDLLSASAAETGRRDAASGVPVKRPPRRLTVNRRQVSREAISVPCVTSFLPRMAAI